MNFVSSSRQFCCAVDARRIYTGAEPTAMQVLSATLPRYDDERPNGGYGLARPGGLPLQNDPSLAQTLFGEIQPLSASKDARTIS